MNRKIFLPILFLFTSCFGPEAWATVRTVSNAPGVVAQFVTMEAAIAAAIPDDTLYVHGSLTGYGNLILNKRLVIMGNGARPIGVVGHSTRIGQITLEAGASGSVIQGFNFEVNPSIYAVGSPINDLVIEYCRFEGGFENNATGAVYNDWMIRNCVFVSGVFKNVAWHYCQNWIIANCLVQGLFNVNASPLTFSSIAVTNTLFYSASPTQNVLEQAKNCNFRNCIVYGGGNGGGISSCELQNNLFFGNYSAVGLQGPGTVMSDNLIGPGMDPMFVGSAGLANGFFTLMPGAPFADLTLSAGSPAIGNGYDGSDMGVHSGIFTWMLNPAGAQWAYIPGVRRPVVFEISGALAGPPNDDIQISIKGTNAN